jgi:hypothetical protein
VLSNAGAMVMKRKRKGQEPAGRWANRVVGMVFLFCLLAGGPGLRAAALQFDVFLGYGSQPTGMDGLVREAGWFMVGCEVHNSGPSFDAVFELTPGQFGRGQTWRFKVELPTNTRKRFAIPVFAGAGYSSAWDARLLDERGRVRAEWTGLRPRAVAWETMMMGSLARTFAGVPRLPAVADGATVTQQPVAVRLLTEMMPEDVMALEGLDALYLNSEKALELRAAQAAAVVSWVLGGGHLIMAVENPAEIQALDWLRDLVPARIGPVRTMLPTPAFAAWGQPLVDTARLERRVRSVRAQSAVSKGFPKYNAAWLSDVSAEGWSRDGNLGLLDEVEFPVVFSEVVDGEALLSVDGAALVIRGRRGLGHVTLLTFSPEREPFRSWENRDWFWVRLLGLPAVWYDPEVVGMHGGQSVDGLFGVMIDSRQVRQLPVSWLLALLVAYLVVIGPLDRYVLRRARREMLTWVTFPAYVVIFSLLIYYIGYRLRAGDTEWNELHMVDVVPRGVDTQWRGRTYASIYSPVPARYRVSSDLGQATLRGEYLGMMGAGRDSSQLDLLQRGDGFDAELFVPVWTSRLCVSDWLHGGPAPVSVSWVNREGTRGIRVRNGLPADIQELWVVHGERVYEAGGVSAGATREVLLGELTAVHLRPFVRSQVQSVAHALQTRHSAFGADPNQWQPASGGMLTAVSFLGETAEMGGARQRLFVSPAGMDLSPVVARGDAVVLAWVRDYAPVPTLRQFRTVRNQESSFFRIVLPAERDGASGQP